MLCHSLMQIVRRSDLLLKGSFVEEPTRSALNPDELRFIHLGKDLAIINMLAGRNGYAEVEQGFSIYARTVLDVGMTNERRDFKANRVWERDLSQALSDRKRGRCDG